MYKLKAWSLKVDFDRHALSKDSRQVFESRKWKNAQSSPQITPDTTKNCLPSSFCFGPLGFREVCTPCRQHLRLCGKLSHTYIFLQCRNITAPQICTISCWAAGTWQFQIRTAFVSCTFAVGAVGGCHWSSNGGSSNWSSGNWRRGHWCSCNCYWCGHRCRCHWWGCWNTTTARGSVGLPASHLERPPASTHLRTHANARSGATIASSNTSTAVLLSRFNRPPPLVSQATWSQPHRTTLSGGPE